MDIKIAKREDDFILNWMNNKKIPYNGCVLFFVDQEWLLGKYKDKTFNCCIVFCGFILIYNSVCRSDFNECKRN